MSDPEPDRGLAALNPVPEEALHGLIPGPVTDAMVDEILTLDRQPTGGRPRSPLPARWTEVGSGLGRPAFDVVVAVVALLVLVAPLVATGLAERSSGADGAAPAALGPAGPGPAAGPGPDDGGVVDDDGGYGPPEPSGEVVPQPDAGTADRPELDETEPGTGPSSAEVDAGAEADGGPGAGEPGPEPDVHASSDRPEPCTAEGSTLPEATAAYRRTCTAPRVDCDEIGGTWTCSSEQIGSDAPKPGGRSVEPGQN